MSTRLSLVVNQLQGGIDRGIAVCRTRVMPHGVVGDISTRNPGIYWDLSERNNARNWELVFWLWRITFGLRSCTVCSNR